MVTSAIPVAVEIEPSGNGYAVWVRSKIMSEDVWWKWYGDKLTACIEAARLGIITRREGPSGERYLLNVYYEQKPDAAINVEELKLYSFGAPPSDHSVNQS